MFRFMLATVTLAMAFGLLDFSYIVDIEALGLHLWAELDFSPNGFTVTEWGT